MLSSSTSWAFLILGCWTSALLAAPLQPSPLMSLKFPKTSERGAPITTGGGGTRGASCLPKGTRLQVVAPSEEIMTAAQKPDLFIRYIAVTSRL